jgi:methylated-DNA-[protein]-cysteine S-methyltransferase
MSVVFCCTDTPFGRLLLVGRAGALSGLYLAGHPHSPASFPGATEDPEQFRAVRRELDEYFAGTRTTFELPLHLDGTPFQVKVWSALADIPYGETISYGELARRVGRPGAARAVGAANGRNPVSIVLPCHRVVGSDGSLTGYGWGVERKVWLLDHELTHRTSR